MMMIIIICFVVWCALIFLSLSHLINSYASNGMPVCVCAFERGATHCTPVKMFISCLSIKVKGNFHTACTVSPRRREREKERSGEQTSGSNEREDATEQTSEPKNTAHKFRVVQQKERLVPRDSEPPICRRPTRPKRLAKEKK